MLNDVNAVWAAKGGPKLFSGNAGKSLYCIQHIIIVQVQFEYKHKVFESSDRMLLPRLAQGGMRFKQDRRSDIGTYGYWLWLSPFHL